MEWAVKMGVARVIAGHLSMGMVGGVMYNHKHE
jgi:hypothetical protein